MDRDQELLIGQMLQRIADELWAGLPGEVDISLIEGRIRYRYAAWSAALFRHMVEGETSLRSARCRIRSKSTGAEWQDVATLIVPDLLGWAISRQHARHASARSLGLDVDGRCADLRPGRFLIDRSLLQVLDLSGVEIREIAALICAEQDHDLLVHDGDEIWLTWQDRTFFVQHQSAGPPILSTWASIGRGEFDGTLLEIPDIVPEVYATAAAGRQLGETLSTGLPRLDARQVVTVTTFDKKRQRGGWHAKSNTEFALEPDWVHLGEVDI